MLQLRGLTRQQEIGCRITNAVMDTIREHGYPARCIAREYEASKPALVAKGRCAVSHHDSARKGYRTPYENASQTSLIRWSCTSCDIAIATNPFEVFTQCCADQSKEPTLQTFIIQHAANAGLYLPPERVIEGGGYSGLPHINLVGPEGGQLLVDLSVAAVKELWP